MSDPFDRLVAIMDRLRDPGGCPWDREQTFASLAPYLLEEAYEAVAAVAAGAEDALAEELGDLLLQIVFLARIGAEHDRFDLDRVCTTISDKMIRRHPHVFAGVEVGDAAHVVRNWEEIKKQERSERAGSALDGVPAALPGLLKAYRMTQKAAALGFDWHKPTDVLGKLREEVEELAAEVESGDQVAVDRVRDEMGDILFVMANLARHLGVEPETALQATNARFQRRFGDMEQQARAAGVSLADHSLAELDRRWDEAKRRVG